MGCTNELRAEQKQQNFSTQHQRNQQDVFVTTTESRTAQKHYYSVQFESLSRYLVLAGKRQFLRYARFDSQSFTLVNP